MIDHVPGSKEWILARQDRVAHKVEMPEWGDDAAVFVRALSSTEKDEFESWFNNADDAVGTPARLAAMGLCDEDGKSQEWEPHEIEQLGEKHGGAIERIAAKVKSLSYVTEEEVEEAEKN